jgi:hypothetical protein
MRRAICLMTIFGAVSLLSASATIINIPDDYSTIQEGIDASTDGDTVLVQPGTYVENINFNGHNTVLGSLFLTTGDTSCISLTIIDGNSSGPVITFENGEDSTAVITGFTIQNGFSDWGNGIICLNNSRPVISNNIIQNNGFGDLFSGIGGGICCLQSSPLILNNLISENRGVAGGGICCGENANPVICGNIIEDNVLWWLTVGGHGGGINCDNSNPIIVGNIIRGNSSNLYDGRGGGIFCVDSDPLIANNIIMDNSAVGGGGGIFCNSGSTLVSNTIFWANSPEQIFGDSATITYCDVQGGWEGEGNIDVDPLFRDPENGDFHLMFTTCGDTLNSHCIDAGDPAILDSFLDCNWGLGWHRSDMGAYGGGDSAQVGIDYQQPQLPGQFALSQNYPNPFNASTIIQYSLPEASDVTIDIYDLLGRIVETLVQGERPAGYHRVEWDAGDNSSGLYFYRIQAGENSETSKMMLLK